MKNNHVDSLLRRYTNAIGKPECEAILEYADYMESINLGSARNDARTKDTQVSASASPMILDAAAAQRQVSPNILESMNIRSTEVAQSILKVVNKHLFEYAQELGLLDQMGELHTMDCLIQKSNADTFDSYSKWHSEAGELSNCDRAMAWMIYLNDNFEGGETEFKFQKHREVPEAGTLVMWPASFTHTHRGGMILSGTKYIATGWIHYSGGRSKN